MAIQNRRGIYSDFDPTKMVEGEFAVVQSGDPNTSDGKAVYIAPTTGTAERLALYKDVTQAVSTAIDEVTEDVIEDINEGVAENVERAETAAENAESSAEEAAEILENKADIDGTYDNLVVGNLLSDAMQTDTAPYLFRPTGGGLQRIGDRCYPTLVGASVVENQLAPLYSKAGNGTTAFTSGTKISRGHKMYLAYKRDSNTGNSFLGVYVGENDRVSNFSLSLSSGGALSGETIKSAPASGTSNGTGANVEGNIWIYQESTPKITDVQIVDLTLRLGSTIADYVYSLEQATAGSGIAWLRSYGFLGGYVPYNAGSLESVEVTGKVVRGFNAWDEEWEVGGINHSTGANVAYSTVIRSKNYVPCLPSTIYYFANLSNAGSPYIHYYDADKTFVGYVEVTRNTTFTTPANAHYIRFNMDTGYGTTYNHDICINLSSDRNGEYEAYAEQTYDYGTDVLNGIFKLDANNKLYADGDRKESDGTITRKYGVVDLGTLNWTRRLITVGSESVYTFYTEDIGIEKGYKNSNFAPMICSKYQTVAYYTADSTDKDLFDTDKSIAFGFQSADRLAVRDDSYTDSASFKTAMSGVMLVYKLATPITEQSTPFTSPQVCYPDGTEEYVTGNGVPVGHETEYPYDLKGLVEELIDVPEVPSANGTYVLKATRTADGLTYNWSWVAE